MYLIVVKHLQFLKVGSKKYNGVCGLSVTSPIKGLLLFWFMKGQTEVGVKCVTAHTVKNTVSPWTVQPTTLE